MVTIIERIIETIIETIIVTNLKIQIWKFKFLKIWKIENSNLKIQIWKFEN